MTTTQVMIASTPTQTRVLVTQGRNDVLKAILPPPTSAHPQGPARLLEGLALWQRHRLFVALHAEPWDGFCGGVGLCDALGLGEQNLYYDVQVCVPNARPRRIRGIPGDFRELRRLAGEVQP